MPSFQKHYESLFRSLGYELRRDAATPAKLIRDAERRLKVGIPAALRDYYLVAGRERRFNRCLNRFLSPDQWTIDQKRLVFLEDQQRAMCWGVSVQSKKADDPPISQGFNDDEISWHPECRKCSKFLMSLLFYHAANGGLPYSGRADVPQQTNYRVDDHGWVHRGEVGGVVAYSRPQAVLCLYPPGGLPFQQKWSIVAAAKTRPGFQSLASEMGIRFS